MFLAIAATDDNALNAAVFAEADKRRVLANVVDDQPRCSFIFPSIIDRSPLVVAVSSSGQAPVLARLLRESWRRCCPPVWGRWRRWRAAGAARSNSGWPRSASVAVSGRKPSAAVSPRWWPTARRRRRSGSEQDLQSFAAGDEGAQGEIALVGAGPGDVGLLTLRGLQVMQQADVVLYDHLVSGEILDLVRRDAERICVGKRAGAHSVIQEETNRLLVELAQQGKRVVRLKGGDPFIFGRGGEELQVAAAAGIPFQVVPGVTAAAGRPPTPAFR